MLLNYKLKQNWLNIKNITEITLMEYQRKLSRKSNSVKVIHIHYNIMNAHLFSTLKPSYAKLRAPLQLRFENQSIHSIHDKCSDQE